ncbi:hypothetical protein LSAT2_026141, partial [Lamellibrachia satsuma]
MFSATDVRQTMWDSDSDDGKMDGGSDVEVDDHEPEPYVMSSSDEYPDAPEPSDSSTSSEEVDQVRGRSRGRGRDRGMARLAQKYPSPGWSMAMFVVATNTNGGDTVKPPDPLRPQCHGHSAQDSFGLKPEHGIYY